jgi:hypothetical protein
MGAILMTPSEHDDQLTSGSKVIDLGGQWFALITVDTIPTESGVNLLINAVSKHGKAPELDDALDRGVSYRSNFENLDAAYEMARAFVRTRLGLELQILTVHTTPKKGQ